TTNAEHGPSFGDDAGDGATSDAATDDVTTEDAASDTGSSPEASPPVDSSTIADTGVAGDGPVAEAGVDASDGGTPTDAGGCSSTMALLAMGGSSLAEARFSGGAWS